MSGGDRVALVKHDLLVIGAAILWGTVGAAGRTLYAVAGAHPITIAFSRLLFSVPVLWLLASLGGGRRRFLRLNGENWGIAAIAASAVALYQLLYFNAVAGAGVMAATVLSLCSAPVFAGLLARVFLREPLPWRWWVALGLSVAGTILIVGSGGPSPGPLTPGPSMPGPSAGGPPVSGPPVSTLPSGPAAGWSGYFMALGAGLCYATYTVAGKEVVRENDPFRALAAIFTLAALLFLPLASRSSFRWLLDPGAFLLALYIGGIGTGVAYALFTTGLRRIPVRVATLYTLLEPLTASLLAVLFLSEQLSAQKILGAIILLAGLLILATGGNAGGRLAARQGEGSQA